MEGLNAVEVPFESWLQSIKTELENVSQFLNWSIWRVPNKLRSENEDAYTPHIISIGPLHHGSQNVLAMETHKCSYTLHLLKRWWNVDDVLDACGRVILDLEQHVRACYGEAIQYNDRELAKMLLLDGCFMIELFLRCSERKFISANDPIFTTSWMFSTLQRDLALLENQIPFFVLERLFEILELPVVGAFLLPNIALNFYRSSAFSLNGGRIHGIGEISHLFHLIHYCCVPSPSLPSPQRVKPNRKKTSEFINCVTALADAGIEFQMETSQDVFHMSFEHGVFKMAPLHIHDSTVSLFRNLIAYEQRFEDRERRITSYFLLMDRLVDTARDVELLVNKRIIENHLGSWEDVSAVFNNMCKHVVLQDSHFAGLCQQVNSYYNTPWYRYKADFKRSYFMNPWTIISLVAAFVLLSLSSLQTIYSMLSYYPH